MKGFFYAAPAFARFFTLFLLVAFSTGLYAQATLSVQGVLTKSDGTAVDDGTYQVTFRLFDQPTGGNQVHSEPINVETIGGVYSVVLGQNSAYPMLASFNTIYYLSVLVGSSELLPRPQLTHAPYALSLLGQNNKFPSTGTVLADAITLPGGAPSGGVAGKGYSFGAGGDQDGGLFSLGDNSVALYANAVKALEASNGGVNVPGSLTVGNGATINGHQTVTGNQTVNGTLSSGNQTVNGFSTVTANQTVEAIIKSGQGIVNKNFVNSGIFFANNNDVQINSNGNARLLIGDNGTNYIWGPTELNLGTGNLFINGIKPKGTTGNPRNIAIDLSTGRVFEESSSRRYKKNIRLFEDNFSLLLKIQPRIYNRFQDPDDIDTSKYFELGYIAEEIDSIGLHKLVQHNNEGQIDGVDYTKMILYAVELLKVQHHDIESLQAELAALKTQNATLNTQNRDLTTENSSLQNKQQSITAQLEALSKRMNSLESSMGSKDRK